MRWRNAAAGAVFHYFVIRCSVSNDAVCAAGET